MAQIGAKQSQIEPNGAKWSQAEPHRAKRAQTRPIGAKWSKTVKSWFNRGPERIAGTKEEPKRDQKGTKKGSNGAKRGQTGPNVAIQGQTKQNGANRAIMV
jgi:hypothetical protein